MLKVAIGTHEGATTFVVNRATWSRITNSDSWGVDNYVPGCGVGHLQTTRLTYNKDADEWGQ